MRKLWRRYAVELCIVLSVVGLCVVCVTEPVRDRHGMGLHGPVRG